MFGFSPFFVEGDSQFRSAAYLLFLTHTFEPLSLYLQCYCGSPWLRNLIRGEEDSFLDPQAHRAGHVQRHRSNHHFSRIIKSQCPFLISSLRDIRRGLISFSGGVGAFGVYRAHYDPPHLIWDLDETVLRSITPIDQISLKSNHHFPTDPSTYFDQIDDDFPYTEGIPNTRTYWRPSARLALRFSRLFSKQHVFTAAQGTYTENIMAKLDPDRKLFDQVVHRDLVGPSIAGGKDISVITDRLHRALLFDDKLKNFLPQNGRNGILVKKYLDVGEDDFGEIKEVCRMVAIALLALYFNDTRVIADYFTGEDYKDQFGQPK